MRKLQVLALAGAVFTSQRAHAEPPSSAVAHTLDPAADPAPAATGGPGAALGLQYTRGCDVLPLQDCDGNRVRLETQTTGSASGYNVFGVEFGSEQASLSLGMPVASLIGNADARAFGHVALTSEKLTYDRYINFSDTITLKAGGAAGRAVGHGTLSGEVAYKLYLTPPGLNIPGEGTWGDSSTENRKAFLGELHLAAAFDVVAGPHARLTLNPFAEVGTMRTAFGAGASMVAGTKLGDGRADPDGYLARAFVPAGGHAVSLGLYATQTQSDTMYDGARDMAGNLAGEVNSSVKPYLQPNITGDQLMGLAGMTPAPGLALSLHAGVGGHLSRGITYRLGANVPLQPQGMNAQYNVGLGYSFK